MSKKKPAKKKPAKKAKVAKRAKRGLWLYDDDVRDLLAEYLLLKLYTERNLDYDERLVAARLKNPHDFLEELRGSNLAGKERDRARVALSMLCARAD